MTKKLTLFEKITGRKKKPKNNPSQKNTENKIPTKAVTKTIKQNILDKYPELKTIITSLVVAGDISMLDQEQRTIYYQAYCEALNLNPLTKPFDIIEQWDSNLNRKKVIMYANKECAAQLRELKGVCIDDIHVEQTDTFYMVVVKGHDNTGKTDCDIGAVPIKGLSGEKLCNAMMKATTKAKRRLTLSICGLGMLDETEVESIQKQKKETTYTKTKGTEKKKNQSKKTESEKPDNGKITFQDIIKYINMNIKTLKERGINTGDIVKQAKTTKDPKVLQTIMDILTGNNKKEDPDMKEAGKAFDNPNKIPGCVEVY